MFDRVLNNDISKEDGRKYVLRILDVIKTNLSSCEDKECEPWQIINDYAPGLLETLEGIKDFYPCEFFVDKYYNQYLANPEECENVTEVYLRLRYGNCAVDNPKFITVIEAKDRNCYVAPPPDGPLKKAYRALNDGQFKESISFYDEYLATSSDESKKSEIALRVSKIYYAHLKDFVRARRYAIMAAEARPNWGEPYILIGKLYASSGPLCGPGRGWDSQIVTWPAIDKFRYAKQIDPSVSAEADKLINQYTQYMPSTADIFMRQMTVNQEFTVPCWIQEKTTIRPAP